MSNAFSQNIYFAYLCSSVHFDFLFSLSLRGQQPSAIFNVCFSPFLFFQTFEDNLHELPLGNSLELRQELLCYLKITELFSLEDVNSDALEPFLLKEYDRRRLLHRKWAVVLCGRRWLITDYDLFTTYSRDEIDVVDLGNGVSQSPGFTYHNFPFDECRGIPYAWLWHLNFDHGDEFFMAGTRLATRPDFAPEMDVFHARGSEPRMSPDGYDLFRFFWQLSHIGGTLFGDVEFILLEPYPVFLDPHLRLTVLTETVDPGGFVAAHIGPSPYETGSSPVVLWRESVALLRVVLQRCLAIILVSILRIVVLLTAPKCSLSPFFFDRHYLCPYFLFLFFSLFPSFQENSVIAQGLAWIYRRYFRRP